MSEDYRYKVSTKLDLDTHSVLEEMANHETNGNISAMLRITVANYIGQQNSIGKPLDFELALMRRKARKKEEVATQLRKDYLHIQKNPNAEFEDLCQQKALESDLSWPPEMMEEIDIEDSNQRWSEKATTWLADYLRDGMPHATNEIREDAIDFGLIDDTDKDWSKFRSLARRREFSKSGSQGFWQWQPVFVVSDQ